ncbi:Vasculin-like protein 1 [Myotis brandtii]|uniref:Vasculin-like protein 1 n=1 Tax=Myotis brandtii TaxID=109478 RepID=S7Q1F4_MYOBR|nr:Vasculin-like protein 1 [Myotis brandtii]
MALRTWCPQNNTRLPPSGTQAPPPPGATAHQIAANVAETTWRKMRPPAQPGNGGYGRRSPTATFEKHGEHLPRGDGRFGVSRRRHNSSDGFFNNGPLRTTGDSWHQPSLFRHDSVDSGVSKGAYAGITGNLSGWHGSSRGHDGMNQRSGGGAGNHRHWNGSFHSRKGCAFQEKPPAEIMEERKEDKVEKLQFEEEDFGGLELPEDEEKKTMEESKAKCENMQTHERNLG